MSMMEQEVKHHHTIADMASARKILDERIDALKAAHKKELKQYEDALAEIEAHIAEAMDAEGLRSVRTPYGTFFFKTLDKFRVCDREIFFKWVLENKAVDVLTAHVSAEGIRAREEIPAGVEVTYLRQLQVRKP